jgi:RNA polymerase sigma-70 factor (ECF subfamily)
LNGVQGRDATGDEVRPRSPVDPDREEFEYRLAEGLIAGRPEAVRCFLERVHHPVFCMAARLTRDRETRRDWTHAVLLAILDDLGHGRFEYRHPGSFWAWFRKRAHYRLLDQYRLQRRVEGREQPESAHAAEFLAACGAADPAAEFERVELRAALEECLERLRNLDQRRALRLLLIDDETYESIAAAMPAPLNTVRAWIRRGRLQLRACLAASLGIGIADP